MAAAAESQELSATSQVSPAGSAPADWHAAIEHMSKVHVEEAARQAAADARVQAARIKPRYEFYGAECEILPRTLLANDTPAACVSYRHMGIPRRGRKPCEC